MASRVPAWKRLGLKLKSEPVPEPEDNSPDVPIHTYDSVAPPTSAIPVTRKRSRSPEVASSKAAKKAKKALKSSDPAAREESPRKAVAFAADAKTEDGDSIKQLFGAWVEKRKQDDPTFVSVKDKQLASEPSKVSDSADDNLTNKERKVQRVTPAKPVKTVLSKPAKPIKPPKIPKGQKPKPFAPALDYLKTFHEAKEHWKFNKINQTLILKHAFDTTLIPSEYNAALIAYVAGLKGLGRIHLRDRALEIRDTDVEEGINGFPEAMNDREQRQQEYEEAVKEYVATCTARNLDENVGLEEGIIMRLNPHQAMKSRMEKRMRIEEILQTLASTPGDPTDYVPPKENQKPAVEEAPVKLEDVPPPKKVRNRKQRTAVFEDSDSSSSDDSSDSEDEDEALAKSAAAASVPSTKSTKSDSDSDSSDSDSSSSDSSSSESEEDSSENDSDDSDSD